MCAVIIDECFVVFIFCSDASKSNPQYHKSLTYFLQHLCIRSPDRSEYRKIVHRSVLTILAAIPNLLTNVYQFLYKLSKNSKTLYRMLAVELITYILECPEIMNGATINKSAVIDKPIINGKDEMNESMMNDEKQELNELDITMSEEDHNMMVQSNEQQTIILQFLSILLSRCSDKIATVRAKALTHLGLCIEMCEKNEVMKQQMLTLFTCSNIPINDTVVPMTPATKQQFSFLNTPFNDSTMNGTVDINITNMTTNTSSIDGIQSIFSILHRRAADSKPIVRRAAIETLESILLLEQSINKTDIQILYDGCCDSSVAIRKQSMTSLSNLFIKYPQNSIISSVWCGSILPMIVDTETTIQEKCLLYIYQLIVEPVYNHLKNKKKDNNEFYIFTLFNSMDEEMCHYFQTAIVQMIKKSMISSQMIQLFNKNMILHEKCIWLIIEMIGKHFPNSISIELVYTLYNEIINGSITNVSTIISILTTLSYTCTHLTVHQCGLIANYICNCLIENNDTITSIIKIQIVLMKNVS